MANCRWVKMVDWIEVCQPAKQISDMSVEELMQVKVEPETSKANAWDAVLCAIAMSVYDWNTGRCDYRPRLWRGR